MWNFYSRKSEFDNTLDKAEQPRKPHLAVETLQEAQPHSKAILPPAALSKTLNNLKKSRRPNCLQIKKERDIYA
jgi:hypothetical protein